MVINTSTLLLLQYVTINTTQCWLIISTIIKQKKTKSIFVQTLISRENAFVFIAASFDYTCLFSERHSKVAEILNENIDLFLSMSERNKPLLVESRWSDNSTVESKQPVCLSD
jgi:hypothetical protein